MSEKKLEGPPRDIDGHPFRFKEAKMICEDERLCNDCGKPFYEEDLDEEGLCEECRAIAD